MSPSVTSSVTPGVTSNQSPQPDALRGTPVLIEAGKYVLRTLHPRDASQAMLDWLRSPAMLSGLNMARLDITLDQLRAMIAGSDRLAQHFIGIFPRGAAEPVGFFQISVNAQHRVAFLTGGVGVAAWLGKGVLRASAPALVEHFFARRQVDKFVLRVLASNRPALFNLWQAGDVFVPEGVLRRECVVPGGARRDVVVFAAYRTPPASCKPGVNATAVAGNMAGANASGN